MGQVRASMVVATDSGVDKYGGVQLAPEALHSMAAALNTGAIPMNFEHDPRQPIEVSEVEARVDTLPNGALAVIAEFTVDEDAWAEVQQRFDDAGVSGGVSFVASENLAEMGAGTDVSVVIAAEAGHFSDEDILRAGNEVGAAVRTRVARLYQFSALEEVARIIIEFGPGTLFATGTSVAGSAVFAALGRLLRRKQRPGKTMIDLRTQTSDGRRVQAIITTDDPDVAQRAVESLVEHAFQTGSRVEYDEEAGGWTGTAAPAEPPALPSPGDDPVG